MKPSMLAAVVAVIVAIATTMTSAHAKGSCAPFAVVSTGDNRSVEYIDNGADGHSRGDQRIGVRRLVTETGNPAGELRWILTVLESRGESGGTADVELYFAMPDGTLFTKGMRTLTSAPDETAKQSTDRSVQTAVVGGTGVYAGARGAYKQISHGNLKETYLFNITCD